LVTFGKFKGIKRRIEIEETDETDEMEEIEER
jgi:hypothetical protein